ncbi:MAG: thiamine biosynthesis protein ApbE [Sphingobacteriales bacterium SCN 48-20]|uniref:FAD:protein FMN transferase n=1 Tax=Terrimonas ferruginea TaxID=249 RepID=UPI00086BEEC5|nr:FAD:protein FMN transferase [Terrimonas ferruginea]MBN8784425.1 FAD:protein FMN transferase [Terrimonas ferruginea]ODT91542.1 MAG: thiamine biosynthesis protein ApbE [Sphingobacteriales bacterium SCN 48-20]OJW45849.1 MAG: thiamine biosynthesis protein ApbE [Sphingobacteriales bacterium 48-107]
MTTENDLQAATEYKKTAKLMGNQFEITVVSEEEEYATQQIETAIAEIQRIERLLSTFREDSQTSAINRMAGVAPVKVDREVFELITRAQRISGLTQGAFDLSYGAVDKRLWNFDTHMTSLPDKETALARVKLINYRNIELDEASCSVFLREKGMRIGFGGIGKGYAADKARQLLIAQGVASGIVNASGDLTAWGTQANGEPWTVGIAHPDHADTPFSYLKVSGMAMATSGNYEKFVLINGRKYSHTINPRTGLPVTGIKSVTVFSPYAELSDAMATPLSIMGIRASIELVNQVPELACILIDDNNHLYSSNNIHLT